MGARKGLKSSVKIPSNSALREKWLEDANFEWARATKVLPVWKYVPGVCTVVRSEAQRSFLTQGQKLMFSNLTKSKRFKLYYIMPLLKTGTTSIHKKILAVLPAANSACWVGFFIGKVLPVSGNSPPLSRPISNTGNGGVNVTGRWIQSRISMFEAFSNYNRSFVCQLSFMLSFAQQRCFRFAHRSYW